MRSRLLAWFLVAISVATLPIWYPRPAPAPPVPVPVDPGSPNHAIDFARDVQPILSSKCYTCHGPDSSSRKGKLRLDQREAALKQGRSSQAPIVPGKPQESALTRRIFSENEKERMPPPHSGKSLTVHEKDVLKRWIAEGAPYAVHWAFLKPKRPVIPTLARGAGRWVQNEIDAFILARLEGAGLTPSPRADRVTLIRRLSLDLRGLPPSLEEVDAFLADQAPDAYAKLVDRMLASPHFGEKMAMHWLDVARFGDTSGYHMDSTRQMWLWRDWVINAFNADMPFDQFTIEQLAGDLLPDVTDAQKIASGFNRNTRFNEEGGVDPEEYVIRYNVDRTNTLGQAWLGLTLGCAECHSHKYDPISHKEYYQLFAYFTGIAEPMLEGPNVHGKPLAPFLKVPSIEQARALAEHRRSIETVEKAIRSELGRFQYIDPLAGKKLPEKITSDLAAHSLSAWLVHVKNDKQQPEHIRTVLQIELPKRGDRQKELLREHFLRHVHAGGKEFVAPFEQDFDALTKKINQIEDAVPSSLISVEMDKPRAAHVLNRGDFQQKGERALRGVPAALPPLPKDAPANRLGLARWLVSPGHPLTARVIVNRLWAQVFGQGIVRTIGDFGSQGEYPTHPDLLDWLAVEFREGARDKPWSVKHLLRQICLSATYQQSSGVRKDAVKIDPQNRLLAFAPRYRLHAEEIRDSALAISGQLNRTLGGPSFLPYQPKDYYRFKNEEWLWTPSSGDEQYRRGLYAFWRRTALHPMLVTLDAPSREECTVQRSRTNTPLAALVTMNDPTFLEAARVLAQRILTGDLKDTDARVAMIFRRATCRAPGADEMAIVRQRLKEQRDLFGAERAAAERFVNIGQYPRDASLDVVELASWMAVCNLVLNLDELLTRP